MPHRHSLRSCMLAASSAAVLAAIAGAPAMAQDAEAQQVQPEDRVVVTGSRIARTDFSTPQPTTVLGSTQLENLGITSAGEALTQIPSNISVFQPTATGNSSFFAGSVIPNLRGLNPFFGSRTLTLIDTRRHVPTNQGDGVDLNFIPSILIDRVETVTGGASAAYGSGAISGVTNILLNRTLTGGRLEMDYGVSESGDADEHRIAAAYGREFAGGRGHFVIGGEIQDMEAVGCQDARDWCARNIGYLSNGFAFGGVGPQPYAPIIPGLPNNILSGDLRANQVSVNGVFVGAGLQADASGLGVNPFDVGGPSEFLGQSELVVGGDGLPAYQYTNLRSPVERRVGNVLVSYELTPDLRVFAEGSYGRVETTNRAQGSVYSGIGFLGLNYGLIAEDNFYVQQSPELQAAVQAGIAGNPALPVFSPQAPAGVEYARFGKDFTEQTGRVATRFDTEVWRVAGGLEGALNLGPVQNWSWDVYGAHGETRRVQHLNNLASNYRLYMAADVVDDGAGNPVCRVTRDGVNGGLSPFVAEGYTGVIDELAAGCQPLNLFGTGPLNPAGVAYAFGELREDLTYKQTVFAANANGDVFEGIGAGPVQLALGVEYRRETGENVAGRGLTGPGGQPLTDAERADFPIQYGESFAGVVDVYEAYAELNVPLLRDMRGAELVEINGAVRQSRYDNESRTPGSAGATSRHDITAWKLSGVWDPIQELRLRGSVSRDIRAPNFRELYYRQIIPAGGLFGAVTNPNLPDLGFPGSQQDLAIQDLQGNIDASPEKADTWTAGFVVSPGGALQGLQFAADYYNIDIKDRLTPASVQRTLDGCFVNDLPEFCAQIFDDSGLPFTDPAANPLDISQVIAQQYNAGAYVTRGIDFSVSYFLSLGGDRSLSFRALASRILEQYFDDGAGNAFDYSGATGGGGFLPDFASAPDWQGNASVTYMDGPVTLTGQVRYVGEAKINYDGLDPSDPGYDPNLTMTYANNRISDYFVFGLTGSYTFRDLLWGNDGIQLWGSVNNLFDTTPPVFGIGGGGTNPVFYDTMGRSYRIGVRAQF